MRDDPNLDVGALAACLREHYGVQAASIAFLPLGYDLNAAVYEVVAADGRSYFLKTRADPVNEPSLRVPRALQDHGIRDVLAPLRTRSGALWQHCADRGIVLYPFIQGENAMDAGLTASQWREFGATLRAIHDSGLAGQFRDQLPAETFAIPSAAVVREALAALDDARFESPATAAFAAFWQEKGGQIAAMLERAEELGRRLQDRPFELVLCHADIHAANILVGEDGAIHLIDWDGSQIAPRERDLLFVVGSRIARDVLPEEEAHFFAGYGPVAIDPEALIYYRYERIIEDIGDIGKHLFLESRLGEQAREEAAALVMSFFAPGGIIASAEVVTLPW